MSRATTTVLFTDIVGSTELRGRLGDDAADDLRRAHDRLLGQAVESKGGRIVKGLGDGIMATFAGASDAVAAAVAIQQEVDRLVRSGKVPVPLAVRVGVSAGDVDIDEGDVHGTPVVEASRLCGAAGGGEIFLADVVRILAGSTGGHDYVTVGPLTLKGLEHPVAATRVEWKPAALSRVPMPAFLTHVGRIFVGREGEVERIGQLWKEALAGERRVALLGGEPGVGKTRLAAQVATQVHDEGGVVLVGRCDEDLGVPYQPFVEALRHYVDHTPPADLKDRLGRYGGELVRLMPELADPVADLPPALQSDPETERYRLFDAVGAWLAMASADQPVLLVVDDLHWAAKPTLLLLRHVLRFPEQLRLLIVGTYRDTELGRRHPLSDLLADLRRQGGVERFSLSGLDAGGVARFVEAMAGHDLEEEQEAFARAIYAETEGNPFFVGEVIRHLAETGAVERRQGRWVTTTAIEELGIPEGIRDVVGRRLSRLSDEANDVLAVAAVLGADFELGVLSLAAGRSPQSVAAALEDAVAARLVSETPGSAGDYRFAHALVRATLYEELSAARRVALHLQTAEAIESVHAARLQDHLPALAHHYAQSAVPAADPAKAVDYARRAGDAALAQLAHDDAVRYYQQALDLLRYSKTPDDDPGQIELLIALGEAQRRAAHPAHRETLIDAARRARQRNDADALARAALANCRGSMTSMAGRVDQERIDTLQAALDLAGDADTTTRVRLIASLALEQSWTADRAELARLTSDAIAMARRLGDSVTLADVLLNSFYTIWNPSTVRQRLDRTDELLVLAEEIGDYRIAVRAYHHRARAAMELGNIPEARRCVERQTSLAAELGEPTLQWMAAITAVCIPLSDGDVALAERMGAAAFAMAKDTQPDAFTFFSAQLFVIRYEQGRFEELLSTVVEYLDDPDFIVPAIGAMAAFMYGEVGRPEESRRYYLPLAADGFAALRFDHLWLMGLAFCAEVAVRLGDADSAELLSDLLSPYSHLVVTVHNWPVNCVSHYLGLLATSLGRFDDADAHFQATADRQLRIGTPTWLAHTRYEWARMLLARRAPGDGEQARELLGQAVATARELGLGNVERRALALMHDSP
jgi:class 3 adenylate cyclase/tetratricopeptide (TPR) repeat protein